MLIDWFTIIAQALNFIILVWLMKRFLYKPIIQAIDAREKRIVKELSDADAKKSEAEKERETFQKKIEEFDRQRDVLLGKARDHAQTERHRLLDEARQAAADLSLKQQEELKNEEQSLHQEISRRAQQEIFAIARKTLTDLAGTSLEERLSEVFTRLLSEMEGKEKADLADALTTASDPAIVRSAFDLSAEQRAEIQNALNETFSAEIHIRFETAPELISGIELTTTGQKVAWSIADYLSSMENEISSFLQEKYTPESKAEPNHEEPKTEAESQ